ncbi:family 78 glycoside hydrolase catalytic domain [uncultured Bacteroides sp.]|uniref:family 78 glycoside hydrolase catalytic domain n=1 Tax=uncultured Bacteroides sp. TaxID=162156 RepID=UPI0025D48172|nr:family 78 glycoside hydrolase catalytic domain [uncultured Bacteroides sp.]
MIQRKLIIFISALLLLTSSLNAAIGIIDLRTEQMKNPAGIDVRHPRLGWRIESEAQNVMQTAYHILVASTPELLAHDKGDCWDSGKIESDASQWVAYQGKALKRNTPYYWKVKVYTNKGEADWSLPAFWSTGLFNEADWQGQWIGLDRPAPGDSDNQWSRLAARYLRKEFTLTKEVKRATVHIAGMGLYELFVNGQRIGDQVLAPAPTDYRKTILYNTYDVTSLIQKENAIGVTLGNGRFYTMRQNYKPYKIPNFGYPKLRLNLIVEYTDGSKETIASNTSWKLSTEGPIRSNNEYDGEEYDARKELGNWTQAGYDDKNWMPAQRVSIPSGTLRAQMMPGMRVTETLKPVSIQKMGDRYILDIGQNMAGWIRFRIKGNAGDSIRLRFAESLQTNGELFTRNFRDARSTDVYVVSGRETKDATWVPRFIYHGFRFVEVSDYPDAKVEDFTAEVVEDEMEHTGSFSCSDETSNKIVRNAFWGIRSNYKGMPVDCPQRNERQPWLGDRTMGCWGESMLFDNHAMYAKWTRDIREAQREDGCIPDVAPAYWNYYSDNVTWPAALPMACDMLFTNYGDKRPIEDNYAAIKKWLSHIREYYLTEDYIITKDKYGDWCVPPESLELIHSKDPSRKTDGTLIATAYYLKILQLMHRFATLQGMKAEADEWGDLEHRMKDAFNTRFLHVKEGTSPVPGHTLYPDSIYYGNNTVTANILPLAFGLVPKAYIKEVAKNAVTSIITTNKGHISTGVIGVQWLLRELSRRGHADVAYLLATNKTYPSWGYMIEKGATTIWELWNGDTANPEMNSRNHVMLLGDLLPWCFNNLAGIRADRWKSGYKHIVFQPAFDVQELSNVDASYMSIYGKITSRWTKTPTHLEWDIELPANTTGEVHLPDGRKEQVGSGKYHFSVDIPTRNAAILSDEFLYEKASFPECHGATIVEMKNGDLVASFFGGTKERNPDCCIWVCRKPKGAKEWSAPKLAADGVFSLKDPLAALAGIDSTTTPVKDAKGNLIARRKACWNPVLFQIPGGDLILFYKIGLKVSDWTGWLVRSRNGGKTWSKREPLPKGFLGPIKNKPEYIDGRIICPSSTEGSNGWRVHFEISDDKGKTWKMVGPLEAELSVPTQNRKEGGANVDDQEGGEAIKGEGAKPIYAIQPSLLKHKDGRLQILCRTRNAQIATAWSNDNGDTWSKVSLLDVPNNNSGTDAVTLKDGRHVLIYNNFSTLPGTPKGPRTPLCIAVSDDGISWKPVLTLEDSPISQYSYPSIIQGKDGKLHAIYTWRRQRIKYAEIRL